MKNFPSTLIKQESTRDNILGDNIKTAIKNIGNTMISNIFGNTAGTVNANDMKKEFADGLDKRYFDYQLDETDILGMAINDTNINKFSSIGLWANSQRGQKSSSDAIRFEDPFLYSSDFFSTINNYKYVYKKTTKSIVDHGLEPQEGAEGKESFVIMESITSPSLFNPFNSVLVTGMTENVPLVNENATGAITSEIEPIPNSTPGEGDSNPITVSLNTNLSTDTDVSDCSIKKLVELSNKEKSELGLATYRYIDFMYCKDLGKIPNNRLITLRKFSGPIGDNIFREANPQLAPGENERSKFFYSYPDIGRLITWFDNDDNKLEDICRYNYHASWEEFKAEIDQKSSAQKDDGKLDKLANMFSPQNNQLIGKGYTGNLGVFGWAAQKLHIPVLGGARNNDGYAWDTLSNYDKHRIYEPPNRVWDTHKYKGQLIFNQDINITFRYKLRSYDNINPKSAFLDLLGNIMVVTYRRGSFWGGENKIYGPQGNNSIYDTGHKIIDKAFDKLGGVWHSLAAGEDALDMMAGWMSNVMETLGNMQQKAQEVIQNKDELVKETTNQLTEKNKKYNWTDAFKGMVKNQLGRPAIYAFNSLLTGENVGPWHLTIGNPRNPIMSIGNLILVDSQVWHSGPLGLDDFPTELNVKVTLKHAKGRDSVDIQKMYTKGKGAIYNPMNLSTIENFRNSLNSNSFGDTYQFTQGNQSKDILSKLLSSI